MSYVSMLSALTSPFTIRFASFITDDRSLSLFSLFLFVDCSSVGLVSPLPATSHCSCKCMGMRARSEICKPSTLTADGESESETEAGSKKDEEDSDEDEFHDCLSWGEADLEVGVDVGAMAEEKQKCTCADVEPTPVKYCTNSLPKMFKDSANRKTKMLNRQVPPHKVAPDGTLVHYWCDMPTRRASFSGPSYGRSLAAC